MGLAETRPVFKPLEMAQDLLLSSAPGPTLSQEAVLVSHGLTRLQVCERCLTFDQVTEGVVHKHDFNLKYKRLMRVTLAYTTYLPNNNIKINTSNTLIHVSL